MTSLISIYAGGILTLAMGLFHTQFVKLFKWKADYRNISDVNRKIFHTIHLALLLLFFLIGALTLIYARELSECKGLALGLNLILVLFWLWRAVWQVYYFKGKTMHYVLFCYFALLCISYLIPILTTY
jgi:hypothetical protein